MRLLPPSIGVRLAVTAAAVVATALVSLGAFAYFAVERALFRGVDPIVDGELDEVGDALRGGLDRAGLASFIDTEGEEHERAEVAFRALDADTGAEIGKHGVTVPGAAQGLPWVELPREPLPRLAGGEHGAAGNGDPPPPPHEVRDTVSIPSDKVRWRLARRRFEGPRSGAIVIEVASRMRSVENALRRLRDTAFIAAPFALLLSLLAGSFVARRALSPLAALDAAARGIGRGPPGARLPRTGAGDEIDRLADDLDGMLERLEAAAERNRRFAADVAHEVRTPIAAVRVRVESAGRAAAQAGAPPEVQARLEDALAALGRVEALIGSLLLICRADEGALEARFGEVDLAAIARDTVEFFAPLAESHGGSLSLEAPDPGPRLRGDATSLGRALASLVDNAIRHGAGKEVVVRVSSPAEGRARVEVQDRGPGVPEAARERLFERFHRASDSREGTGLGLALARALAAAHGGTATYAPREGGGSVFALEVATLPANASST